MATADESGMEGEVLERSPGSEYAEFHDPSPLTYSRQVWVVTYEGNVIAVYDNRDAAMIAAVNKSQFEAGKAGAARTAHTTQMSLLR